MDGQDVRGLVAQVIEEFSRSEQARKEPAYQAELLDERRKREALERRVNELIEENTRSRRAAEEAERGSAIRAELQRLGVAKIDLAYKAVQDDVVRAEDGRLVARTERGDVAMKEYLTRFVGENPEFLPARIAGGSGTGPNHGRGAGGAEEIDLDKIRPGMPAEERDRVAREIMRFAQTNGL